MSTTSEDAALEVLKNTYFAIHLNFNRLFAACENDDQRDLLRIDYVAARNNFHAARVKVFRENDPMVRSVTTLARDAEAQVDAELQELKDISGALQAITGLVSLGSMIASLIGPG